MFCGDDKTGITCPSWLFVRCQRGWFCQWMTAMCPADRPKVVWSEQVRIVLMLECWADETLFTVRRTFEKRLMVSICLSVSVDDNTLSQCSVKSHYFSSIVAAAVGTIRWHQTEFRMSIPRCETILLQISTITIWQMAS